MPDKHCKVIWDGLRLPVDHPVVKVSKQLLELEEEKRLTGQVVLHLRRGVPMLVEWPQRKAL